MASSNRPARIYVAGTYTHENKGDAALLESFKRLVLRVLPRAELTFATTRPDLAEYLPVERVVALPLDPHGLWSRFSHRLGGGLSRDLAGWLTAGQLVALDTAMRLPGAPRMLRSAALREIAAADLVALLPGGYLMAPEVDADLWLYHASAIVAASRLERPIVLFPGSYGPFAGIHQAMARRILNRCQVIMVRERLSAERLQELHLSHPAVEVTPDAAFAFRDDGRGAASIASLMGRLNPDGRPLVAISAKPHHFPNLSDPTRRWRDYIAALASVARMLVDEFGAAVVLVPQSVGSAGEDRDAGRAVAQLAGQGVTSIEDEMSPYQLAALYGRSELVIGTRMHANILAMAAGTPVVAIAYEHKTPGIMEMVGLRRFSISIDNLVATQLRDLVAEAWRQRSTTRELLRARVVALQAELSEAVARVLDPYRSIAP